MVAMESWGLVVQGATEALELDASGAKRAKTVSIPSYRESPPHPPSPVLFTHANTIFRTVCIASPLTITKRGSSKVHVALSTSKVFLFRDE